MASPDTDELATIPLPAGEPATVPQARVEPEQIEPDAASDASGASGASDASDASDASASAPAKQGGRWWRGLTGSLASGLAVLAAGVLAVAGVCLYTGAPGPGATLLIGHPVAAVLALVAQRVADRRNGPAALGAGIAVVLFTISALTLFWLT